VALLRQEIPMQPELKHQSKPIYYIFAYLKLE
jgi:hypothetical protein